MRRAPLAIALCLATSAAGAQEVGRFALRGELGLGATLSGYQQDSLGYGLGAAGALRGAARLAGPLWIQVGVGHWILPAEQGAGYVTPIDVGPRLAFEVGRAGRLWLDVNPGLAVTGGDARFGLSAGAGFAFRVGRAFEVGPMARYQLVAASSSDNPADAHLAMFGVSVGIQPTPAPTPAEAPARAAPPPPPSPADTDRDGVLDPDDRCPQDPAGRAPDATRRGCPTPDSDADGVLDPDDRCISTPAGPTPDPARAGCPDGDDDNDGVRNGLDQCPQQHQTTSPDPARAGCPAPDRDGDAVPDATDACPDRPGAPDANPRRNGCPGLVVVTNGVIRINRPVFFATNADVILPRSTPVLTAVAETLRLAQQIRGVRVEGHTDNQGVAAANMDLSRRRAESVRRWLIERGVDGARLTAEGLGATRPIRSNLTRGGRAANRRVEFHITDPAPPSR